LNTLQRIDGWFVILLENWEKALGPILLLGFLSLLWGLGRRRVHVHQTSQYPSKGES